MILEQIFGTLPLVSGIFQLGKAWGWAALLWLAISAGAQAQFTSGDYSYTIEYIYIDPTGVPITITGYSGPGGNLTIPEFLDGHPVEKIQHAFEGCGVLTSVRTPDSGFFRTIGAAAFAGCTNLTNIVFQGAITSIGDGACYNCTRLTNIELPSCAIGEGAFARTGLQNVAIPRYATQIGAGAFSECAALTAITVAASNTAYSSTDGVLFNKSKTTLMQYPAGIRGDYLIPGGVTNIAGAAFGGCSHLAGAYFSGAAPALSGSGWFDGATNATIYRLPGAAGWPEVPGLWAGRPTALWLPETRADASLGVQEGRFGFNINWASGQTIVVEACTNLADPVWTPVGTNTLDGDSTYFGDAEWSSNPGRFYRLCLP